MVQMLQEEEALSWQPFQNLWKTIFQHSHDPNNSRDNRPYRLFTFDPMASFPCLPVLARQACAWRLHLMFPARICCFLILSPITNLSLNVLCTKHEDWCHTKTRLLGQKWINGKVYCVRLLPFIGLRSASYNWQMRPRYP